MELPARVNPTFCYIDQLETSEMLTKMIVDVCTCINNVFLVDFADSRSLITLQRWKKKIKKGLQ